MTSGRRGERGVGEGDGTAMAAAAVQIGEIAVGDARDLEVRGSLLWVRWMDLRRGTSGLTGSPCL